MNVRLVPVPRTEARLVERRPEPIVHLTNALLDERLDGALIVGMLFVVLGIVIVNTKRQLKLRRRPVTQGAAHD